MNKAALWLMPALALTTIGSMTYATSRPNDDGNGVKKYDSKVVASTVHFENDADFGTYLTSIRSFMLVPPRDGLFGASRVPTFHGASRSAIPGYKELDSLAKKYSFTSYVVGTLPQDYIESYKKYAKDHPDTHFETPKNRITIVHAAWQNSVFGSQQRQDTQNQMIDAVNNAKKTLVTKPFETYSEKVKFGETQGWLMAKAVIASDKSCYSCHANIILGTPIGYVMAVIHKNQP